MAFNSSGYNTVAVGDSALGKQTFTGSLVGYLDT